jgi:hypothetical protein
VTKVSALHSVGESQRTYLRSAGGSRAGEQDEFVVVQVEGLQRPLGVPVARIRDWLQDSI